MRHRRLPFEMVWRTNAGEVRQKCRDVMEKYDLKRCKAAQPVKEDKILGFLSCSFSIHTKLGLSN